MLKQRQKVLAKACVNAVAPGVVDTEGTRTGGISDFEKEVVAARRVDASDNLTTSPARSVSLPPPRIPHGLPKSC